MTTQTAQQFDTIITHCRELFHQKTQDYGTAWRILRLPSITDQVYIKAARIRSIQEKGKQRIPDQIEDEFVGIINYCLIALMQIDLKEEERLTLPTEEVLRYYDKQATQVRELLFSKNHDYGEAWRSMRVSSITDIILMKLIRIKQIEDNEGNTLASEGVEGGYRDMINYAVFSLILLEFNG